MAAEYLGARVLLRGSLRESMWRLSRPLLDVAWWNIVVSVRGDVREIYRGNAWRDLAGKWHPAPWPDVAAWRACYQPLSARDLAFCEAEIQAAGCHAGHWKHVNLFAPLNAVQC